MLEWILQLDHSIFYFINGSLSNSLFDSVMPAITDLHKQSWFKLVAPIFLFLLFRHRFGAKKASLVIVGLVLSLGVSDFVGNVAFKKTIQRARPGDNPQVHAIVRSPYGGYSFMSNHATNMFNLATYTSQIIPGSGLFLYPVASVIAFSRVYNGVHFPTDVLCGGLLGSFWGFLFSFGLKKIIYRKKQDDEESISHGR